MSVKIADLATVLGSLRRPRLMREAPISSEAQSEVKREVGDVKNGSISLNTFRRGVSPFIILCSLHSLYVETGEGLIN